MRRLRSVPRFLAVTCLVAVGAFSCSSDDDSEPVGGGPDSSEAEAVEDPSATDPDAGEPAGVEGSDGGFVTIDLFEYLADYDAGNDNVELIVEGDQLRIVGNGLPDFETGEFPNSGNPNAISAQDVDVRIPLDPVHTGTAVERREVGITIAGIKFEPGTAERDAETGVPIEALQDLLDLGLDFNNAHVQPTGSYHFHADPVPLSMGDATSHSNLVGFMFDGFPVYGMYGYGEAEAADGTVRVITSSWQLRSGERPADEPAGTYDGTYTTDFEFVAGSGDLDECNGMWTVTPEFPDGTYAYFITEEFPYISRCLMGEAEAEATPTGPGPRPN